MSYNLSSGKLNARQGTSRIDVQRTELKSELNIPQINVPSTSMSYKSMNIKNGKENYHKFCQ